MYRSLRTALITVAVTVLVAVPATAAKADSFLEMRSGDTFCASILSKELDSKGLSKVAAEACSTTSVDDAHAKAQARLGFSAKSGNLRLFTEYKDAGFGTDLYTYFGDAPCDGSGYSVRNFSSVASNTSSVEGFNSCNWAELTKELPRWFENQHLPAGWIGSTLNDNVDFIHVYNA